MTVEINPEDLRIDTFHACEHSGFVHTNHTAVRITHLPTGAYVESKIERSLHKNKQRCVELLPAAIEAKIGARAPNRAEELITQLEAEIAKRDARIAEFDRDLSLAHMACELAEEELAALKSNQPSTQEWPTQECPVTGAVTDVDPSDMGVQQPSAGVVDSDEVMQMAFEIGEPADDGSGYWFALESFDEFIAAYTARLNPCRAQAVQICKLGMYGQAYDTPDTYRAYTYADQPGNDIAYRLGGCLRAAHCDGGGDFIDFGLALLRRLQDKGFGVFQIAAAPSAKKEDE